VACLCVTWRRATSSWNMGGDGSGYGGGENQARRRKRGSRMIRIDARVQIDRPATSVFEALTNVQTWPTWASTVEEFRAIESPPLRVGSPLLQISHRGGKLIETPFEISALAPGKLFGLNSANLHCWFELSTVATGTNVLAHFELQARGWTVILYRLFLKRWVDADLRRLKRFVEAR
jgi:uncharacterized protein YndB with AHSA1/START domain